MELIRKMNVKTNEVCVGDQIVIPLIGGGNFTATAQKVTDDGILFLFDEVIAEHAMNEEPTNKGGFEKSDLNKWLHDVLLPAFPIKLRKKVSEITIPSYGEIFGHDYNSFFYEKFIPDEDEQFESMKRRGNRVCDFEDDWCRWWLRNATKQNVSSAGFASVGNYGAAGYYGASYSRGVRPEFWLVK